MTDDQYSDLLTRTLDLDEVRIERAGGLLHVTVVNQTPEEVAELLRLVESRRCIAEVDEPEHGNPVG